MKKIKELILKYKIYFICVSIIILSSISLFIQHIERKRETNLNISNNEVGKIAIYITGEIKNPGVYYIDENSRLNNILDIAGGLTDSADIDKLNLAKKLVDSDKIVVPKKDENKSDNEENSEDVDKENNKININKADLSELTKLSGIGEATATKIIEYRKNNYFCDIEDIMNVPGIGQNKFNTIKDNICTE